MTWTPEQLTDYLMGRLSPEQEERLESDLTTDSTLQAAMADAEQLFADVWLASATPIAPSEELGARLRASTSRANAFLDFTHTVARLLDISMERARAYMTRLLDPDEWVPGPGEGLSLQHISGGPLRANAIVGFIRVEPGHSFPEHKHVGEEIVMVLQGQLVDSESGEVFERGHISVRDPDTEHEIGAPSDADEDLIYLTIVEEGMFLFGVFLGADDTAI